MRSLSAIAVLVAAGLLVAGCGSSSKKGAQPSASKPSVEKGMLHAGSAMGKASSGNAIQEGATGATMSSSSRSFADAARGLKGDLVRTGKLTLQPLPTPSSISSSVPGAAVQASDSELKQGSAAAQTLNDLGTSLHSGASALQPLHAQSLASPGLAVEVTSAASLHAAIPSAAALQAITTFAKESSSATTRVASSPQTLSSNIGKAIEGPATESGTKAGQSTASALSALESKAKQGATAGKQFQAAGPQTIDVGRGEAVQATSDAGLKAGPSASEAFAALSRQANTPKGQSVEQSLGKARANAVTGTPTRTKAPSAALNELNK